MRALAAKQITHDQHGNEIIFILDAYIEVDHGPLGNYFVRMSGHKLDRFTSLHRAKNAIRRYFGIESRRQLRWEEVSR